MCFGQTKTACYSRGSWQLNPYPVFLFFHALYLPVFSRWYAFFFGKCPDEMRDIAEPDKITYL